MIKEKLVLRKEIKKLLYTIIVFLLGMISVKQHPYLKDKIDNSVYKESPNYMKVKRVYEKYFDNSKDNKKTEQVFSEKITYQKQEKYKDGVNLTVQKNYQVPNIESGIIIYMEDNKLLISQIDGITVEYSNIRINDYKLYDYIEKGKLLGETIDNTLYLSFEQDGEYLDYKKYI